MSMPGLVAMWSVGGWEYYKPVSRAGSASGTQTDAYDDDTSSSRSDTIPGQISTASFLGSNATTVEKDEDYTFSGSNTYTKVKLFITLDWTSDLLVDAFGGDVYGSLGVKFTSNNGTLWTPVLDIDSTLVSGTLSYTVPIDLGTITAATLSNMKIRLWCKSTRFLETSDPAVYNFAGAGMNIQDVYIGVSN